MLHMHHVDTADHILSTGASTSRSPLAAAQRDTCHPRSAQRMADGPDHGEVAAVWRGTVRAAGVGATPDQAWALLRDFCSLHRWVSSLQTCRRLEGADGRPGCVRYCAGPVNMAAPDEAVGWSKERLVDVNAAGRSYSYEVVETNKGFGRYWATIAVEHHPAGFAVRWSFEADPVKGWTLEGFVGYLEKLALGVAKRLQEEIVR